MSLGSDGAILWMICPSNKPVCFRVRFLWWLFDLPLRLDYDIVYCGIHFAREVM